MNKQRWKSSRYGAAAVISALCLLPPSAGAMQTQQSTQSSTTIHVNEKVVVVSGRMSLGYLQGEAGEFVYVPETGHKLSELQWKLDEVVMLGLGGSISPNSWLTFNADVWFAVNEGNGNMNDYDWFVEGFPATHWSNHLSVDLTTGLMFDINAEMAFYSHDKSKFFGIAGFKHDTWEWEAFGGDYTYSVYGLYDTTGSFPDDVKVITYEQTYYVPYIGIGFNSELSQTPISFSGRLVGSWFAWGDDKDQHHLRDLVFEEEFDEGTFLAFDLAGAYHFTNQLALALAYHYQRFDEMKGSTEITDIATGEVYEIPGNSAGMDHYSSMWYMSLNYSF